MTRSRHSCLGLVLGVLMFASASLGQYQRTPYPPRPEMVASKPALEKVNKARAEVNKAQAVANQAAARVRKEFEAGAEYQAASTQQKQAQSECDVARKRVGEAVRATPAYKKAEAAKKEADVVVARLKADNAGTQDILTAATKAMQCGAVLSKMEADALEADKQFVDAKKRMLDANASLAALNKQGDELVKADSAWQQARKDVEAAEAVKAQADKELADAQAQDNQRMAQWREQCAQIDRQNRERAAQEAQQRRNQNNNNNRRY